MQGHPSGGNDPASAGVTRQATVRILECAVTDICRCKNYGESARTLLTWKIEPGIRLPKPCRTPKMKWRPLFGLKNLALSFSECQGKYEVSLRRLAQVLRRFVKDEIERCPLTLRRRLSGRATLSIKAVGCKGLELTINPQSNPQFHCTAPGCMPRAFRNSPCAPCLIAVSLPVEIEGRF